MADCTISIAAHTQGLHDALLADDANHIAALTTGKSSCKV